MTQYKTKICERYAGNFTALIVRVDYDGNEEVLKGYGIRHFKTRDNAVKSSAKYMLKLAQAFANELGVKVEAA